MNNGLRFFLLTFAAVAFGTLVYLHLPALPADATTRDYATVWVVTVACVWGLLCGLAPWARKERDDG